VVLHASEPEAPEEDRSAVVTDCNARSIDGCLCMQEERAIALVAEVKACRRLQPSEGGSSGWLVGVLALIGALIGNLARGAFGL
jgi:hypothetical protein